MDWRFSTFLLFLFALLVGVPWATSEAGLCGLAIVTKATSGAEATTCFEFWLNRYQTMLAVIAAVVTAVIYGLQLRSMNASKAEMEKARSIQLYDIIVRRSQELASFLPLQVRVATVYTRMDETGHSLGALEQGHAELFAEIHNEIISVGEEIEQIIEKMNDYGSRYFGGPEVAGLVDPVLSALREANYSALEFKRNMRSGRNPGDILTPTALQISLCAQFSKRWAAQSKALLRSHIALSQVILRTRENNRQYAAKLNNTALS
ncbi:hypothetical protein ACLBXO_22105 [Methylobacterium sp. C33D]